MGPRSAAMNASSVSTATSSWRSRAPTARPQRPACAHISRAVPRAVRSTIRCTRWSSPRARGPTMRRASSTHSDVVVVGGGVAAGACVTTLRESGYDGTITVASAEPHAPYTRPGLTKQVLRGEKPPAAALWRPDEWYRDHSVVLLTGARAGAIDPREHTVEVAGRRLGYGSLVLATGAEPRRLSLGTEAAGRVHVLRSFADADDIRPHLGEGTRWLVIGGGFIGTEFAASAALTGSDVSLVMAEDVVLERP